MLSFRTTALPVLIVAVMANVAAAQSTQAASRDSVWEGTLIGLGAGLGSAAALDAAFCENGFGGCDFPWAAYLTLGGIGAGAGAGIDFLIGRSTQSRATVRLSPIIGPSRRGVLASLKLPSAESLPALERRVQGSSERRDSVWNGTLIGAGIGAAGGAVWARQTCGTTDDECFALAGPAGIITGAGVGAAIGALADALR